MLNVIYELMFNIIYYDLQFSNKENILLNIYFIFY